jgi:glucose-6-phosphate-specific signal transduction histidine kinase
VSRRTPIADAIALAAFAVIGVLTHGSSVTALVRDLLVFLGCWFAVALATRLYARPSWTRLLATWLAGITAAVLIRAMIVGHWAGDFYGIALAFTLLFVLAARAVSRRSVSPV